MRPLDDTLVEGNETVVLTLANHTSYTVGTNKTATVNLNDNDTATLPAGTFEWAYSYSRDRDNTAYEMISDRQGNFYLTGSITNVEKSFETQDVWISKFDANGNQLWARYLSTPNEIYAGNYTHPTAYYDEAATGLALAPDGSIILAGTRVKTAILRNTAGGEWIENDSDMFLAKFDAAGNPLFGGNGLKIVGSTAGPDEQTWDVTVDTSGIYLAGSIKSATVNSARFVKTDLNGNYQWERSIGKSGDTAKAITVSQGFVYLVGDYDRPFNNGNPYAPNINYSYDAWLAKYDVNGNAYGAQGLVNTKDYDDAVTGIATDGNGNLYITGLTGTGSSVQENAKTLNTWLMKYDTQLTNVWTVTKDATNSAFYEYADVVADAAGNAYVSGIKVDVINGVREIKAVALKYDANNYQRWETVSLGATSAGVYGFGIALSSDGRSVYIGGNVVQNELFNVFAAKISN